jgi:hypothetical protein
VFLQEVGRKEMEMELEQLQASITLQGLQLTNKQEIFLFVIVTITSSEKLLHKVLNKNDK